jgi:hypothetical protein
MAIDVNSGNVVSGCVCRSMLPSAPRRRNVATLSFRDARHSLLSNCIDVRPDGSSGDSGLRVLDVSLAHGAATSNREYPCTNAPVTSKIPGESVSASSERLRYFSDKRL